MKKLAITMLVTLLALFSAACGSEAEFSVSEIGEALNTKVAFSDTLTALSAEDAMALYALSSEEVADAVVYISSGATAEEISVWQAADSKGVKAIEESITQRMNTQLDGYKDYMPEEVPKLENYILKTNGKYLVLCVTDDRETANEVLTELDF
ncbi:MAG: DUF4358 domain-containing protein [Bacillota bacterium]|nr:DUF4358 domain-containing protein [Bacillota bacterium]